MGSSLMEAYRITIPPVIYSIYGLYVQLELTSPPPHNRWRIIHNLPCQVDSRKASFEPEEWDAEDLERAVELWWLQGTALGSTHELDFQPDYSEVLDSVSSYFIF